MPDRVSYRLEGDLATIAMDDGKVNVMSVAMLRDLAAAYDRAEADQAIVLLRSARSGVFSAGFDLKVFAANDPDASLAMVRAGAELALRILRHPCPTIALVEGHAFPMGAFLTLASDIRIGVRGAWRMGLNEVAIGIAPPGFAIELARSRLQPAWLSRTVTLGEMFGPDDAATAGLLDRVIAAGEVAPCLEGILAALRAIHRPSHTLAKQRLRHGTAEAMRAAIEAELTLQAYRAGAVARSAVRQPAAAG